MGEKTGEVNGLKINLEKTKIMKVRGPEIRDKIGEFEVVKETKYLGVQVGGRGRNIFEIENKKWLEKAEEKANTLIAQIKKIFFIWAIRALAFSSAFSSHFLFSISNMFLPLPPTC